MVDLQWNQDSNSQLSCYEFMISRAIMAYGMVRESGLLPGVMTCNDPRWEKPIWRWATLGLLATDLVILNYGQVTRTTPELVSPSPNYRTNGRMFELTTDLTCIALLQGFLAEGRVHLSEGS
ncbi:hypothetical protein TNCV_3808221 [Trichonephila clavipes]|nr:hypothetical protein TNCV_3808221 [Trichonephila clavipes]